MQFKDLFDKFTNIYFPLIQVNGDLVMITSIDSPGILVLKATTDHHPNVPAVLQLSLS
jgi:hypothetical protein